MDRARDLGHEKNWRKSDRPQFQDKPCTKPYENEDGDIDNTNNNNNMLDTATVFAQINNAVNT